MSQDDDSPERAATPTPLNVIDLLKLAATVPLADPPNDLVERTLRRCLPQHAEMPVRAAVRPEVVAAPA